MRLADENITSNVKREDLPFPESKYEFIDPTLAPRKKPKRDPDVTTLPPLKPRRHVDSPTVVVGPWQKYRFGKVWCMWE